MSIKEETVSIKIQPNVYGAFRQLPNKVWYALAEYVDNSVQSYIDNKDQLNRINTNYVLTVKINIMKESDTVLIEDNAAGIGSNNYWRAFEPANIPVDNTGLNEYGMGMKTASIWLSDVWSVVTKAVGETEERTTVFDLKKVINEKKEVLQVKVRPAKNNEHYTRIELKGLSDNSPKSQQLGKIKNHLTSIYRKFIRSGELELWLNGELLKYKEPKVLYAPFYKNPVGESVLWKKNIDFKMGDFSAKGFIGLLETMSTSVDNGISLFRRGRVIVGSHDEKYRPLILVGQLGSPRDKRLFGELELEGFGVSFNKGSFVETDYLEILMEGIKTELIIDSFNLLEQGQKYTKPKTKTDIKKSAKKLLKTLKKQNDLPKEPIKISKKEDLKRDPKTFSDLELVQGESSYDSVNIGSTDYNYKIKIVNAPDKPLYTFVKAAEDNYDIEVNFGHEMFNKDEVNEVVVAFVKALALAELSSPNHGTREPENVRLLFHKLIGKV